MQLALFKLKTPANALLILAKRDSVLLIVDPSSLRVIARVPLGNDPHEVIASADGKTAYVSNYGSGAYNTLAVVDLVTQKALPPIDLGPLRGPHGLTFVDGKVWFTAERAKAIGSYDPDAKSVDWILGTGQDRTHMIYVSPDMKLIVTTNVSSGTVSMIEHRRAEGVPGVGATPAGRPIRVFDGDWNETVVRVGSGSDGFDVSPDGKEIWVGNAGDGTVSIIDLAAKQVSQTLAADVSGANRLKFHTRWEAGPHLELAWFRPDRHRRRDSQDHQAHRGGTRRGGHCYATRRCSRLCSVFSGWLHRGHQSALEVAGHIEAGRDPDGLAWATRR